MKEKLLFAVDFVISHAFWIVAAILLALGKINPASFICVALLAVIAFGYAEYKKKQKVEGKGLVLHKSEKSIDVLYWIAFVGFLGITFWSCYKGFLEVSGTDNTNTQYVMLVITLLLTVALACCAWIAKSHTKPKTIALAVCCFLLFDFFIALPFNWLFFFSSYKGTDQIARDKIFFDSAIKAGTRYISPKLDSAKKNYAADTSELAGKYARAITNLNNKVAEKANTRAAMLNNNVQISEWENRRLLKVPELRLPKDYYDLQKKIYSTTRSIYNQTAEYDSLLKGCIEIYNRILITKNTNTCAIFSQQLKNRLVDLYTGIGDTSLIQFIPGLSYKEPTPLEFIKALQGYILGGGSLPEAIEPYRPLFRISLLASIIVDILPLLLSFLYGQYKRKD